MTLESVTGIVRFKVDGQRALPKWQRNALSAAMSALDSPPEALRFQCRIATDARKNFALIELAGGETLTLHPKARPQFGKDHNGRAYLTATMTYSGDGEAYTLRWLGEAVPPKMQEVAVQHDKGESVSPTTIALNLADAQVMPIWKAQKRTGPVKRDHKKENAARADQVRKGRGPRQCARLTDADLAAV